MVLRVTVLGTLRRAIGINTNNGVRLITPRYPRNSSIRIVILLSSPLRSMGTRPVRTLRKSKVSKRQRDTVTGVRTVIHECIPRNGSLISRLVTSHQTRTRHRWFYFEYFNSINTNRSETKTQYYNKGTTSIAHRYNRYR